MGTGRFGSVTRPYPSFVVSIAKKLDSLLLFAARNLFSPVLDPQKWEWSETLVMPLFCQMLPPSSVLNENSTSCLLYGSALPSLIQRECRKLGIRMAKAVITEPRI